jgi:hypothetical protein
LPHDPEQLLRLMAVQTGGRLVEYEQFDRSIHRPRNCDQLLDRNRIAIQCARHIDVEIKILQ